MRHVERLFWLICLAAIGFGLFLPVTGLWLKPYSRYCLMAILFFTYLKIDWRDVVHHVRKPLFLAYMAAIILFVLPVGIWAAAQVAVPAFTIGIVILASMPSGVAGSSLTHVAGGNAALALVGTTLTTFLAPLTIPLMVRWLGGHALGGEGTVQLLRQTEWLALVLFTPAVLAWIVRRVLPRFVERQKGRLTGMSIIALGLLILAIVATNSEPALRLARETPGRAAGLFAFMAFFSVSRHLSAFAWAFWRPWQDRVGLSINSAYVNNGLAMTFAAEFFKDVPEAVLPSVLVEITMVLCILPLKRWARHMAGRRSGDIEKEPDSPQNP